MTLQSRLATVVHDDILATIGAVIVGFGIAAFAFRIQRELQQGEAGYVSWIPWADRLLIGVVTVVLLLVLFPIALAGGDSRLWAAGRFPAAVCSGSVVALVGYIPALLAHYRFSPRLIWPGLDPDELVSPLRDELARLARPGLDPNEIVRLVRDELVILFRGEHARLIRDVRVRLGLDPVALVSMFRDELASLVQSGIGPDELVNIFRGELARLVRDERVRMERPDGWRKPGEPAEKAIVGVSAVLGMIAAVVSLIVTS